MGLMPASYKVTARSVSRVLGDGQRQSDRSLKGHEAGVRKGQPWAANHHRKIVAVYENEFGGSVSEEPRRRLRTRTRPQTAARTSYRNRDAVDVPLTQAADASFRKASPATLAAQLWHSVPGYSEVGEKPDDPQQHQDPYGD